MKTYNIKEEGNLERKGLFIKYSYFIMPTYKRGNAKKLDLSLKFKKGFEVAKREKDYSPLHNCITYEYGEHNVSLCQAGLKEVFGEIPEKFYYKFS